MAVLSTLLTPLSTLLNFILDSSNPNATLKSRLARLTAVTLLLVNLKVIPLFWHARFWSAVFKHLIIRRYQIPTPSHLFASTITTTRSPLYECDFNFHKSNSTYFSDLDIARTHLVTHLIKKSLRARRVRGEETYVALGGVTCLFRREIKPYEKYEIWTRVMSWDDKWLWVVSYFVTPGLDKKTGKKKIFATALSKYVFKSGRRTIPPATVLEESGVMPVKSLDGSVMSLSDVADGGESTGGSFVMDAAGGMKDSLHPHLQHLPSEEPTRNNSPTPPVQTTTATMEGEDGEEVDLDFKVENWDWETVEKIRAYGLKICKGMLMLDAIEGEFEKGNLRVDNLVVGK